VHKKIKKTHIAKKRGRKRIPSEDKPSPGLLTVEMRLILMLKSSEMSISL